MDRAHDRTRLGLRRSLADVHQLTLQRREAAAAPAPTARRPDPSVRHEIDVAGAPSLGPEKAKITIVEFSDFQCPFCGRVSPTLEQIRKAYPDQVRIVFKHLPLAMHPNARPAAAAAEAAHRQGKFWEMHDKIFENQSALSPAQFEKYAQELGLDLERFRKDAAATATNDRISADEREAEELGVSGTPSFFVNGKFRSGAMPFEMFKGIIEAELEAKS